MTKLIFIRHGESEANLNGCFAGQLDIGLSEKGKLQAELTAEYIARNYRVDAMYSSDLKRAYDTAKPLAEKIGRSAISTQGLREINAGAWQGLCFDELQACYADTYGIWLNNIGLAECPLGERVKQLSERIWRSVSNIAQAHVDKTIVLVTHATPIRALVSA